jgi:hypothetical protein
MTVRTVVLITGLCAAISASACTSSRARQDAGSASATTIGQRLWSVASKAAHDAGAEAASASAVKTTELAASDLMARSHTDRRDVSGRWVWLVQIRGNHPFSCECNVYPGRSGDSTANYMLITVNVSGQRMLAGATLYAEPQPIESLGRQVLIHA